MMRARLFPILIISFVCKSHSQDLLANGSFEDRNICIEFRAGCAPEAWFRIPLVPVTIHNGPDRNHYVNVVMENMRTPFTARNYIYTRLLCNLQPGKKYRFKTLLRANEEAFDHLDILMIPYEPNRNKQLLASEKQKDSYYAPTTDTGKRYMGSVCFLNLQQPVRNVILFLVIFQKKHGHTSNPMFQCQGIFRMISIMFLFCR